MRKNALLSTALAFVFLAAHTFLHGASTANSTLAKIKAAGTLNCGIDIEEPEYTLDDAHGNRAPFDGELCKAVAVAVLGKNANFKVKPYRDEADSLKALKAGEIDLLASASPYMRWNNGSFLYGHTILLDAQGILVNRALGLNSSHDFAGKKLCFLVGTEIEAQTSDYMRRAKIAYIPGPFSEEGEMEAALVTGTCAAVTADMTQLAYERIAFKGMAKDFTILPETIAIDPLAPVVRSDDPQWAAVVDWSMQALVLAEENGITRANIDESRQNGSLTAQRILGNPRGWAAFLDLDNDWAAREIEAVGNYGELFDRTIGPGSTMRLDRGLNKPWTLGGLLAAEPVR